MNSELSVILDEFQARLDNKLALMQFRFANACVKADPAALLSINVECDSRMLYLEKSCDIVKKDEDKFLLVPQDESYIDAISDGVKAEHPEFEQQIFPMKISPDRDAQILTLLLTVPPVNKDRHDILTQAVDGYKDVFEKSLEVERALITPKLALKLLNASKEEKDEVDQALNKGIDDRKAKAGELADDKKKEIDEAYQRYLEKQSSPEGLNPDALKADASAATSMKME